jgi:hypothetical protein
MGTVRRLGALIGLWAIGLLMVVCIPYVWSHEPGVRRVLWVLLAVGVLVLAGLITRLEIMLRPRPAEDPAGGVGHDHDYLSTGCLHGEHTYCQAMTGQQGEKRPGRCKFCDARCRCACHTEPAT